MVSGCDVVEGVVDKALQLDLKIMDVHIELQEITIKLVLEEIQQVIGLALHIINDVIQILDHLLKPLDVGVLLQRAELVDGGEHVNQLVQPLGEQVKL